MTGTQLALVKHNVKLVKVGSKKVSANGFRSVLFYDHLQDHLVTASNKWCLMECMASTFYRRNSEHNRKAARQRLNLAFRYLLDRGIFIVIDYHPVGHGHHGEAKAVKILELVEGESMERQMAKAQIDRMLRRKQLTEERYSRASQFVLLPADRNLGELSG